MIFLACLFCYNCTSIRHMFYMLARVVIVPGLLMLNDTCNSDEMMTV